MAAEVNIVAVGPEHGQRLDNFLFARLKGLPKSRVYRMVRRGEVRVNGARTRPNYRVQQGDNVRIPPYRGGETVRVSDRVEASRPAFDVLRRTVVYDDDDLLVLDKPSGMAVHGGSGVSFGVIETLRRHDPATPYALVHRIDRDTSGCLAVAKNRRTLLSLHAQLRERTVKKRYDLVVAGCWPTARRLVDKPLARYALANGERRVRVARDGEPSRTGFAVVHRFDEATWLAAFPQTGRTHQIRVHAAASGHPILGDDKYARGAVQNHPRLFLHASELKVVLRGRPIRFKAPVPAEFEAVRGTLRALSGDPSRAD